MRDVVTGFYSGVLEKLIAAGMISRADKVLVTCGGPLDEKVTREVGFADPVITNISDDMAGLKEDAENLSFADGSFDVVIVHAGLHHCYSPHLALLEMYRVARKCVIAFESRDSLLMRTAVRLGLTLDYEIDAVTSEGTGGVANGSIPNFIYRWTEREIFKTVASFDPTRIPDIRFFYDFRLPLQRFAREGSRAALGLAAIEPVSRLIAKVAPSQCNEFAFAIFKNGKFHPWIRGH